MVDHAIFSKDGPNLNNPAETNRPSVIPNKYRLKKRNAKGRPSFSKARKKGTLINIGE